MTTPTDIQYALMAGASYISNRPDVNKFPIPSDWSSVKYDIKDSGFEATSFVPTGTTLTTSSEIVISFAGTDFSQVSLWPPSLGYDFWNGNIPLITGVAINGADQLVDAVEYYLQVKASVPAGTTITLTGHSLRAKGVTH